MKNVFLWLMIFIMLPVTSFGSVVNADLIQPSLQKVYQANKNLKEGKNASYIPELAKVNPNLFGIAIATVDGKLYTVGDVDTPFALESIAKLFMLGLALKDNGQDFIFHRVGLNATGEGFNSLIAIERNPKRLQNPLVNAGAIQIASFIKGKTSEEKWQRILGFINAFADNKTYLSYKIYQSEMSTNQRNRAIVELLNSYGMMGGNPLEALDEYTKACSVMVTAKQLALMGATLANHGKNPSSKMQVLPSLYARDIMSEMVVNGLYENSGYWFVTVGMPAKSGVGGGFLAISPGKLAIAVFSPPLDAAGNSVRGQAVVKTLSEQWQLHLLDPADKR